MKRILSFMLAAIMVFTISPTLFARVRTYDISDEGIDFIKEYEGFRETPYLDNGTWRVGYGTKCDEGDYPNGITVRNATKLLKKELEEYTEKVNNYILTNNVEVTQSAFDALVSFTYNLGSSWMATSYKFSGYLINGLENYTDIEILDAYVAWCHVGKKIDEGLVKRRMAEVMLILHGDYSGDELENYTYVMLDSNGGTVSNDVKCLKVGDTLDALPDATRDGYVFTGWYDGNKKITDDTEIKAVMSLTAKWFLDVDLPFADVSKDAWYFNYVGSLYIEKVIDGMTPTTFEPQGNVTYGQALKLILLATGLEPSDDDSGGHWADKYKNLAIDEKILPTDFAVNLNTPITRLEIASIAAKAMGLSDSSGKTPFADTADTNVMKLYNAGIVEGTTESDGTTYYYPNSSITRAEISTIIWRILDHTRENTNNGKIYYGSHALDALPTVKKSTKNDDNFYIGSDGFMKYEGQKTYAGIDVSYYQGKIDWQKVAAAGVEFAMIRVGGRGYGAAGNMFDDVNFEYNIKGATEAGIHVGIYFFSQAVTVAEAREEAQYVIDKISGYDVTYPVVFDWERVGGTDSRTYNLGTDALCNAANAFCEMIEDAGYTPMVYFNAYIGYMRLDLSRVNKYDFWFARYYDVPSFYYDYTIWQYTDQGSVDGINGRVDMNISFVDYSKK